MSVSSTASEDVGRKTSFRAMIQVPGLGESAQLGLAESPELR